MSSMSLKLSFLSSQDMFLLLKAMQNSVSNIRDISFSFFKDNTLIISNCSDENVAFTKSESDSIPGVITENPVITREEIINLNNAHESLFSSGQCCGQALDSTAVQNVSNVSDTSAPSQQPDSSSISSFLSSTTDLDYDCAANNHKQVHNERSLELSLQPSIIDPSLSTPSHSSLDVSGTTIDKETSKHTQQKSIDNCNYNNDSNNEENLQSISIFTKDKKYPCATDSFISLNPSVLPLNNDVVCEEYNNIPCCSNAPVSKGEGNESLTNNELSSVFSSSSSSSLSDSSDSTDSEEFSLPTQCSISELLQIYTGAKKLAQNTSNLYRRAVKKIFANEEYLPLHKINWKAKQKMIFTFNEATHNVKRSTFTIYVNCLKTLVKWGFMHDFIEHNYLEKFYVENCSSASKAHRQALNCEEFCTIGIAQATYRKFTRAMLRYVEKNKTSDHLKLWLIHSVLCTRRSETIRVIKQYKPGDNIVTINTKCHNNFPIPIIKEVADLIVDIQPWIQQLTERTAAEYILRCIPPKYKTQMCAHGTRAIFRTVIELMDLKNVSDVAKETYLSHLSNSGVFTSYMRSKLVKQREKIQKIWSTWVAKILPVRLRHLLLSVNK